MQSKIVEWPEKIILVMLFMEMIAFMVSGKTNASSITMFNLNRFYWEK